MTAPTSASDTAVRNALATISRPCDVPANFTEMQMMARILAASKMLPDHLRGDEASIMAVMIAARALDIPMWAAFQGLIVIEGKTGMSAHMMQALVLRAGFGLFPVQDQCNADRAVVQCVRPGIGPNGSDTARVEFTIEDALRADLVHRSADGTLTARSKSGKVLPWEKYVPQMLKRRATSVGARDYYQDVLLGMVYLPDEIGGDIDGDGNPVFRESTRVTISPEVQAILLRIQNAETTDALREVWTDAKVGGLLDAVNLAGESVRNIIDMRRETLERRAAKDAPKPPPAPVSDASADDAQVDAETTDDVPAETAPAEEDAPTDEGPVPDPPETRQDDDTREGVCNALAGLYDNWDAAAAAIIEAFGLHPDDIATSRLEEFARARIAEQEGN